MSFITRCPSCGTAFRVVADQLKIADGWVRCGHCRHVFDATLDLQPAAESPAPVPAAPAEEPVAPPPPAAAADPAGQPTEETPPMPPAPEATSFEATSFESEADADLSPASDEPSFVRQARRRAFWRRPAVRAVLALLGLALGALLVGQVAWHWRDEWAARYPSSRPWLAAFCAQLGCTIAPPRRPRDVVIEGSVLLRRAPDRYSFHLVVRNNADIEVAAPALELTLTDVQDQVLVRRVWTPDAWPQPTTRLAPGAEWPLQFELAFDHPQAARMAGYRAVLFYP